MRSPHVLSLLATYAIVAAGCGGSDTATPTTGTADRSDAATTATTTTGTYAGPLGGVRQRLVAAGYRPRPQEASNAVAGLDVGGISVYAYATAAEAERDYREIKRAFAAQRGRGVVEIAGERVYFFAQERQLTDTERKRFANVVIAGEAIGP